VAKHCPGLAKPLDQGQLSQASAGDKSLFASFSSEKEEASFFEKKRSKKTFISCRV
jgi:hypothetical protein